jgi:type IV secretion system protein VirD4
MALFLLLAAVLLTLAALYLAAALFLLANKVSPALASWNSLPDYWHWYGDDAQQHQRLLGSTLLAFALAWIGAPVALVLGGRRQRPLHGAARFANAAEIRQAGLLDGKGLIVGRWRGQYLMLPGQQYVMVSAPTRSGKGTSIAVPNLLNWPGSALVLDIKGEACDLSSGFRARHGQQVFVFAPFDEAGRTHRYNPLGYVRTDERLRVGDLLEVGQIIYPNDSSRSVSSENFFNDQARNLFLALGLYLLESPALPRTIGELLRQASGNGKPLKEYLAGLITAREQAGQPLSDVCVAAFNRFLSNPENTFGSILSTFNAPLTIFADPITDAATSGNDFALDEVRKRRITVYVVVPFNKLGPARLLMNLFFTQAINLNVRELPSQNPALKHECLLLMDEFTAPGRIDIISRSVGFMPGYNLRMLTICQSLAQLSGEYGEHVARSICTNHALQVLFAPKEQADAESYSKMLGNLTERVVSRSRSTSYSAKGGGSSTSESESQQRRALLLPQDFKELGAEHEVIVLEGHRPILAEKARYYTDPRMTERLLPSVLASGLVPVLDLDRHLARIQRRHRPLRHDEAQAGGVVLEQLAHDLSELPPLAVGASDAEVESFVEAFFARLEEPGTAPQAQGGDADVVAPHESPAAGGALEPRSGQASAPTENVGEGAGERVVENAIEVWLPAADANPLPIDLSWLEADGAVPTDRLR